MKNGLIEMLEEYGFEYKTFNNYEVVVYQDDIDMPLASLNLNTGDAIYTPYCMKLSYRKKDNLRYILESLQSEMIG